MSARYKPHTGIKERRKGWAHEKVQVEVKSKRIPFSLLSEDIWTAWFGRAGAAQKKKAETRNGVGHSFLLQKRGAQEQCFPRLGVVFWWNSANLGLYAERARYRGKKNGEPHGGAGRRFDLFPKDQKAGQEWTTKKVLREGQEVGVVGEPMHGIKGSVI